MVREIRFKGGLTLTHESDPSKPWPPPDPDRIYRVPKRDFQGDGFTKSWEIDEFRKRQAADIARYEDADGEYVVRRRPFHERLEQATRQNDDAYADDVAIETDNESSEEEENTRGRSQNREDEGEEAWRNKEGERLADFGVDEVADFYDEDDVPLAELLRRRQTDR